MGRYGTREDELDDLLRREVFVDLYRVVRGGLRDLAAGLRAEGGRDLLDFERTRRSRTAAPRSSSSSAGCTTRDDGDPGGDRGLQRGGLHRHAGAARLAARAACGGARGVRAVPAAGAAGVEAGAAGEGRARRAARGAAATRGERAALAASCSTTTTASASRSGGRSSTGGDDARRSCSRTGRRSAGSSSSARRGRRTKSIVYTFTFPAQEHKLAQATGRSTRDDGRAPGRSSRSTATRGRSSSSAARSSTDVPLPRGADPGRAVRHDDQEAALERLGALAARRRRPLPGARVGPPPRAVRPRRADDRARRADGARLLARRPPPRHPGAARLGQDVDVGAPDRASSSRAASGSASPRTSHKAIHNLLEEVEEARARRASRSAG